MFWRSSGASQSRSAARRSSSSRHEQGEQLLAGHRAYVSCLSHAVSGQTLISQRVLAEVDSAVDASPVGEIEMKGFARPVTASEVRGLR